MSPTKTALDVLREGKYIETAHDGSQTVTLNNAVEAMNKYAESELNRIANSRPKITGDEPYYPNSDQRGDTFIIPRKDGGYDTVVNFTPGVTIRQQLAAMAMQGFISSDAEGSSKPTNTAKSAVKFADALINELNQPIS